MTEDLKVRKTSGETESFSSEKIVRSIIRAGGTVELAGEIAKAAAAKVKELAVEGLVTTQDIRNSVIEFLREKNEDVAKAFEEFKQEPEGEQ